MEPSILTSNGTYFDLLSPGECEVTIEQIGSALANICRFTGHCREFYSVAQHSVLVSLIVPPELALLGLLHDASEAFVGDVATPLKLQLRDYKAIENRIQAHILQHFGLGEFVTDLGLVPRNIIDIKEADLVALATEARDLMPEHDTWPILKDVEPLPFKIQAQPPTAARVLFLQRFDQIQGENT